MPRAYSYAVDPPETIGLAHALALLLDQRHSGRPRGRVLYDLLWEIQTASQALSVARALTRRQTREADALARRQQRLATFAAHRDRRAYLKAHGEALRLDRQRDQQRTFLARADAIAAAKTRNVRVIPFPALRPPRQPAVNEKPTPAIMLDDPRAGLLRRCQNVECCQMTTALPCHRCGQNP